MGGCHTVVMRVFAACVKGYTASIPFSFSIDQSALGPVWGARILGFPLAAQLKRGASTDPICILKPFCVTKGLSKRRVRCWDSSFWPLSPGSLEPVMCLSTRMTISKAGSETMSSFSWSSLPLGESCHMFSPKYQRNLHKWKTRILVYSLCG